MFQPVWPDVLPWPRNGWLCGTVRWRIPAALREALVEDRGQLSEQIESDEIVEVKCALHAG